MTAARITVSVEERLVDVNGTQLRAAVEGLLLDGIRYSGIAASGALSGDSCVNHPNGGSRPDLRLPARLVTAGSTGLADQGEPLLFE